jgi:diguanylate cyclase (GGDEF)-like protein
VLELTQSTMTDSLTMVYNRSYLMQQLKERCGRAAGTQTPVCVLFVDIDHFKKVNDTHGHLVGDEVLRTVALSLKETIRGADVLTRYGGEEFVLLSATTDTTGLARQAERIRQKIQETPVVCGPMTIQVTASVGGACISPSEDLEDFSSRLLETADAAMYVSKRQGRNRSTIFETLVEQQTPALQPAS